MKIYSKIIGILLTISLLIGLVGIVIVVLESNGLDEKIGISLLFIPAILFLHYMYIHNFGFNLKTEIPKKSSKLIIILTLVSLVISLIVPLGYLSSQVKSNNDAKEMIDRGKDKGSSSGLIADLKTKYEDSRMLYVLNIITPEKKAIDPKYETFLLELRDKDGFNITTIEIKDYTSLINENNETYGISSNSSNWISLSDYQKIAGWNILFRTK